MRDSEALGGGHVTMEAEREVVRLQAKESKGYPATQHGSASLDFRLPASRTEGINLLF